MSSPLRQFPHTQLRRNRYQPWVRDLIREHEWTVKDLVQPLFVIEGQHQKEPIKTLPGLYRFSIDGIVEEVQRLHALGIPMVALFPSLTPEHKTLNAEAAFDEQGLIPRTVRAIKAACPDMGVMGDVALDPYTSHGQDGLLGTDGVVSNELTVPALMRQAVTLARAGVDVVAPSDMMDGRVGAIRKALDEAGFQRTLILSYSAKYASLFYGPFRDAVRSEKALGGSDKKNYQMDPANVAEALHEVALDLTEGADMVMVKPGMPYLDVLWRVKERFQVPTAVYQVSGEYAMLQTAIDQGILSEGVIWETLTSFKRAGADMIITYFAGRAAEFLKRQ